MEVETIPSNARDEELLQGDPAPFNGLLVPYETYRKYQATVDKYKYRIEHDQLGIPCPDLPDTGLAIFDGSTFVKIGVGLVLGLVLGVVITH